jgi:C4-dicarboxylate-specific signal transduction histidine kinase
LSKRLAADLGGRLAMSSNRGDAEPGAAFVLTLTAAADGQVAG